MRIIFTLILSVLLLNSFKSDSCRCSIDNEVFLTNSDTSGTNIRETPNGRIVETIKNNPSEELFVMMQVLEVEDKWFKIMTLNYPDTITGWIYAPLTSTRIGRIEESMDIYSQPDSKSKIAASFIGKKYAQMLTCKNGWTQIKIKLKSDKFVTGWIESNYLCGNPYTYCN